MSERFESVFFVLLFGGLTLAAIGMSLMAFGADGGADVLSFWN